jgi:ABC-type Zn uptake system ZnuABC Zn-binding protein ZnuA
MGSIKSVSADNPGVKKQEGTESDKKLSVVTSVAPIANIIKNIGGDRIALTQLIPDGVDSHTFELRPSDAIKLQSADLVIINGLHLEAGIEDIINSSLMNNNDNNDHQVLRLADSTIDNSQWIFDFSFPAKKGDPNPHLWLNVAYAMSYANLTKNKLIQMDPNNAAYYRANAEKYLLLLNKLDAQIMNLIKTVPPENRKLLTYHDSWAYFAPRYGMAVTGAVQPSDFGEPTPKEVGRLIDQLRSENVPALFGSEVFPSKVLDQIGRESHVKYVTTLADDALPGSSGDPEHSYVGMMLENVKNMVIALGGNTSGLERLSPNDTFGVGDL